MNKFKKQQQKKQYTHERFKDELNTVEIIQNEKNSFKSKFYYTRLNQR